MVIEAVVVEEMREEQKKNVANNSKFSYYPHLKTLLLWVDKDKLKGGNLGGLSSTYINYYGNLPYHTMTLW